MLATFPSPLNCNRRAAKLVDSGPERFWAPMGRIRKDSWRATNSCDEQRI